MKIMQRIVTNDSDSVIQKIELGLVIMWLKKQHHDCMFLPLLILSTYCMQVYCNSDQQMEVDKFHFQDHSVWGS